MDNKQHQRQQGYAARNAQADKDRLSQLICSKFIQLPTYQQAETVMWYVHCRSEVRTMDILITQLNNNKRIVIPYCTRDCQGQKKLGLWLLKDRRELTPGTWGILEPPKSRWNEQGREVTAKQLDMIMVPGVCFDRFGGRIGNGAGYYDKLLQQVRPDTCLTAVAYESQIFDKVVMEQHDVYMDNVLTEKNCYSKR